MKKRLLLWSIAAAITVPAAVIIVSNAAAQQPVSMRIKAPELREVTEWINSKPLTLADLKGQVVALHFWTFG